MAPCSISRLPIVSFSSSALRNLFRARCSQVLQRLSSFAFMSVTPNPALKRDAPPAMQAPRPLALRSASSVNSLNYMPETMNLFGFLISWFRRGVLKRSGVNQRRIIFPSFITKSTCQVHQSFVNHILGHAEPSVAADAVKRQLVF